LTKEHIFALETFTKEAQLPFLIKEW